MSAAELDEVYMILDPETKEAVRLGEGTAESGPLFFTSQELLEEYARANGIEEYQPYPVPGGVLTRMRGKPHWLDGKKRG